MSRDPRTRSAGQRSSTRWALAALVAVAAALAGCAADDGDASGSAADTAEQAFADSGGATAETMAPPGAGGGASGTPAEGGADAAAAPVAGRQVIRTASLTVEVGDGQFGATYDRASRLATELGGFVASSDAEAVGDADLPQSGQITMRVPVDRFDEARARLAALGTLKAESITGQDVTDQLVDLGARITTLQAQEEAFRALLEKATTITEIVQVQDQLLQVRTQIEQLRAQEASLQDRAALSTLTVTIEEPAAPSPGGDDDEGLDAAWNRTRDAFVGVVGGLMVVAGALLPLLLLSALVLAVAWPAARRSRRRAAAREAEPRPPAQLPGMPPPGSPAPSPPPSAD